MTGGRHDDHDYLRHYHLRELGGVSSGPFCPVRALSAIFGLGDGSRWEPAMFAFTVVLLGRLILWQNIRFGTKWRSRLYGGDDER